MKIRLLPFLPRHYVEVWDATIQFEEGAARPDPWPIAARMALEGVAMTGVDEDGAILGCAGLLIPSWGPSTGWAMIHRRTFALSHADRVRAVRAIRRQLDTWITERGLVRVEANVDASFLLGQRFIAALGFTAESMMPNYLRHGDAFTKFVRIGEAPCTG